jgi:L-asparaginase
MTQTLPLVVVMTTGGTIASRLDPKTGGVRAAASAEELVALVPDLAKIAQIELRPLLSINSWNMAPAMMFGVVREVRAALDRADVAGVVITHGTDTIEETGLMAELLVESDKPVVFVASMRNLSELSPDGPRNLRDAVSVAADPASRGRGALVVVNETIHAARYVIKTNTVNPHTFLSPDYGPVGMIPGTGIRYLHRPPDRRTFDAPALGGPVHIVKAVSGSDSAMIHWLIDQGTRGIVLEGSGAGNVPSDMMDGIERAIGAQIPVVLTSRTVWGFLSPTYGSGAASGGGFDLMRMGVIPASHLPSPKARIALMVALGAGLSHDSIRELLATP